MAPKAIDLERDRIVRVRATDAEWLQLRRLALDENKSVGELVTEAVRSHRVTRRAFQ